MDIQTVSTAIATKLSTLGIHVYDYGPDAPVSPAVFIYPLDIPEYQATYDGAVSADFVVRFLINAVASKGGQAALNALLSPAGTGSAIVKLKADSHLGNTVSDSFIKAMRNYGVLQLPDQAGRYYSAELIIGVYA